MSPAWHIFKGTDLTSILCIYEHYIPICSIILTLFRSTNASTMSVLSYAETLDHRNDSAMRAQGQNGNETVHTASGLEPSLESKSWSKTVVWIINHKKKSDQCIHILLLAALVLFFWKLSTFNVQRQYRRATSNFETRQRFIWPKPSKIYIILSMCGRNQGSIPLHAPQANASGDVSFHRKSPGNLQAMLFPRKVAAAAAAAPKKCAGVTTVTPSKTMCNPGFATALQCSIFTSSDSWIQK